MSICTLSGRFGHRR